MGLESLIPPPSDLRVVTARVISVSGHTLTVDLGGAVQVLAADTCNPRPNDSVVILVTGSSMIAIAAVGGPVRQAKMTVTANATNTVTGVLNGVSTAIPKVGSFTAVVGQDIPLFWPADGSNVWAMPNEQQATTAPPAGGAPGGAPGGGVSTGKSTYAPTQAGVFLNPSGPWFRNGSIGIASNSTGFLAYGASRFRELQGRTITGLRAYIPGGSGSITVWGHPHASHPAGAPTLGYNAGGSSFGGWRSLPIGLANYLIGGSGTGGLAFTIASGSVVGPALPAGQLEFSWRV